jgi:hypothetical protein
MSEIVNSGPERVSPETLAKSSTSPQTPVIVLRAVITRPAPGTEAPRRRSTARG